MAKPRAKKTTTRRTAETVPPAVTVAPTEIARRAYDLYLTRGCQHGHDLADWFQAERALLEAPASLST